MPVAPTLPVWASVATRLLVCAALAFAAFFVPMPFAAAESHGSHAYTYDSHPDTDASAPDTVDVAWPYEAASRSLANGVVRHVYDRSVIFVAPRQLSAHGQLRGGQATMISELGQRHVARLRECLDAYEAGCSSLQRLISNVESLVGLLYEEADPEWLAELESESNRLEFVNPAGSVGRGLTDAETAEVVDAVSQLRLITEPYE